MKDVLQKASASPKVTACLQAPRCLSETALPWDGDRIEPPRGCYSWLVTSSRALRAVCSGAVPLGLLLLEHAVL